MRGQRDYCPIMPSCVRRLQYHATLPPGSRISQYQHITIVTSETPPCVPLFAATPSLLDVMRLLTISVQRRPYFWEKHYIIATDSALICAIFNLCFPGVRGFCPSTLSIMPFYYCCHIIYVLSVYCLDFVYFYSFCFTFVLSYWLYIWHVRC